MCDKYKREMQIIPKANTLRKSVLLYRGIRYRKGYGVHSPFVFNLITKVIEEHCSYYRTDPETVTFPGQYYNLSGQAAERKAASPYGR